MVSAPISGITGQNGQHLAELLYPKGYDVFGMAKGQNNPKVVQSAEEMPLIDLIPGDLADPPSFVAAPHVAQPNKLCHFGLNSFVAMSFSHSELTTDVTGLGVVRMLEAVWIVDGATRNPIPFDQASSSEFPQGTAHNPERTQAASSLVAERTHQSIRSSDHRELPRILQPVRMLKDLVQSVELESERGFDELAKSMVDHDLGIEGVKALSLI